MGLQRQVLLNVINSVIATFRWCGAVLVLWLIAPTISAFFTWQIIVSVLHVFLMSFFLWRSLPATGKRPSFQVRILLGVWRFAAGMSGITILATLLTQTDKIILSRMLSLEMFGYYTLAGMVAMTLYRLIGPVFMAVYPRFTQLISLNDQEALRQLYHKACQFMSVLILPATAVIAFFSYEVLLLWTQNPTTAEKTHILVSILIIGTALNGLMNLPYALQLAHGWTRLGFYVNLISVVVLVPLTIFMTWKYGAVGAAVVWVILNTGYLLIAVPLMHMRLLPTEKWQWYRKDVGIPLVVAFTTAAAGRLFFYGPMTQLMTYLAISIVSAITLAITILATPKIFRLSWLLQYSIKPR
jgi:O-antigen/teichoic acid export membrane protein